MSGESNASKNKISMKNSIKTKLIVVMLLVCAVPLIISSAVSYKTSTDKAMSDALSSMNWETWYLESEWQRVIDNNLKTIQAVAMAPSTIAFMKAQDDEGLKTVAQQYLLDVDTMMADDSLTVLTGSDGMQVLRTKGDYVDVSQRDYFKNAMSGKTDISDVITSSATGARQVTFSCPIKDNESNAILGIVQRN